MGKALAIAEVFKEEFYKIATVCGKSTVSKNDTGATVAGTAVAFVSQVDSLCLYGIVKVSETSQYIDLRARNFLGEVPSGWDYSRGLQENHNLPDEARLGICIYEGKEILSFTDDYRFSMLWEPKEISDIMGIRHVKQFSMMSANYFGLNPIPGPFFFEMLEKEGIVKLLSMKESDLRIY